MSENSESAPQVRPNAENAPERGRPIVTRRDFLAGAGAGVAATAVVAGGIAVTRPQPVMAPQPAVVAPGGQVVTIPPPAAPAPAPPVAPPVAPQAAAPAAAQVSETLPASMRKVKLDIDRNIHEVTVDVRESLWEIMVFKLGMASSNLGCDRAQCGACAVVVDGRAVNGCSILAARLGRGQKILTVDGLVTGTGEAGLHPIQRAFWMEGGFQCGICTRGFIMSTYALLQNNKSPSRAEIREGLAGNICRCGEYPRIYVAVEKAAAAMRSA